MATSTYAYFTDGWLKSLTETNPTPLLAGDPDSTTIRTDLYTYDTAGRTMLLSSVGLPVRERWPPHQRSESVATGPGQRQQLYSYDGSGQLATTTDYLKPSTNGQPTVTTTNYGPDGNPTPAAGTAIGANNQIMQDANNVYEYDKQGNLVQQWTRMPVGGQLIPQSTQSGSTNTFTANNVTLTTTGEQYATEPKARL